MRKDRDWAKGQMEHERGKTLSLSFSLEFLCLNSVRSLLNVFKCRMTHFETYRLAVVALLMFLFPNKIILHRRQDLDVKLSSWYDEKIKKIIMFEICGVMHMY